MGWKRSDDHVGRAFRGLALLLVFLAGLSGAMAQRELRVAAAADLEPVLPPILAQFEKQTGIHCEATFQSSAALTTQILNGAPFNLFFSADMNFPQRLSAAGLTVAAPVPYAKGMLVLWTRNDSHLVPSLALLRDARLKRLAIANPDRAPYGRAAVAALHNLGVYEALRPRFVTAENIGQTAQFVDSGNADAGLISMTAAKTARLSSAGSYFVIPSPLYPAIEQGAVVMKKPPQRVAAQKLLDFVLSRAVQRQLAQSGLTPVR